MYSQVFTSYPGKQQYQLKHRLASELPFRHHSHGLILCQEAVKMLTLRSSKPECIKKKMNNNTTAGLSNVHMVIYYA